MLERETKLSERLNEPYAYRSASGDVIAPDRTHEAKAREAAHAALDLFIDANITAQHSGGMPEAEWIERMRAISTSRHRLKDAMVKAWQPPTTAQPCKDCGASLVFCEFNQRRRRGPCCLGCAHVGLPES